MVSPAMSRLSSMAVPLALAGLLVACGSSSPKPSGSAPQSGVAPDQPSTSSSGSSGGTVSDACSLLSQDDVARILGQPVKAGQPETTSDTPYGKEVGCQWIEQSSPNGIAKISIWNSPGAYDSARSTETSPPKDLPGLGEKAFLGGTASVWVVQHGKTLFAQFYAFEGTDAEHAPKSQALAEAVVPKL